MKPSKLYFDVTVKSPKDDAKTAHVPESRAQRFFDVGIYLKPRLKYLLNYILVGPKWSCFAGNMASSKIFAPARRW